jgi:hypothetical protein
MRIPINDKPYAFFPDILPTGLDLLFWGRFPGKMPS